MHVHASDKKLTAETAAKFFVKENDDTVVKEYYQEMYQKWSVLSDQGFYYGK